MIQFSFSKWLNNLQKQFRKRIKYKHRGQGHSTRKAGWAHSDSSQIHSLEGYPPQRLSSLHPNPSWHSGRVNLFSHRMVWFNQALVALASHCVPSTIMCPPYHLEVWFWELLSTLYKWAKPIETKLCQKLRELHGCHHRKNRSCALHSDYCTINPTKFSQKQSQNRFASHAGPLSTAPLAKCNAKSLYNN